ncbi:MAG: hypothetical protein WB696_26040 [Chthoniobacterales bacterium]
MKGSAYAVTSSPFASTLARFPRLLVVAGVGSPGMIGLVAGKADLPGVAHSLNGFDDFVRYALDRSNPGAMLDGYRAIAVIDASAIAQVLGSK